MSSAKSLRVYDILNKHFKNDADSKALIESVEEIIDKRMDQSKDILATKQDLNAAITSTKIELLEKISEVRTELLEKISEVRTDLLEKIYRSKTETITWIVAVGIIQFMLTILSKRFL